MHWLPCRKLLPLAPLQGELSAPLTEGLELTSKETRPHRAMRFAPAPPPLGRGGKKNSAASHRPWLPCQVDRHCLPCQGEVVRLRTGGVANRRGRRLRGRTPPHLDFVAELLPKKLLKTLETCKVVCYNQEKYVWCGFSPVSKRI